MSQRRSFDWWRLIAPLYPRLRTWPPMRQILRQERRALQSLLSEIKIADGLALDIGSGSGDSLKAFPPTKRVLLDASFEMLHRAPGALKIVGRAEYLPFHSRAFCFISAIGVLEYLQEPEMLFEEARSVSQPGATLLLTSAPRSLLNFFRYVLGPALHLRNDAEIVALIARANFQLESRRRTLLQSQWLLRYHGGRRSLITETR